MSFNSVDPLIRYKDVQFKANKAGEKLTFRQEYAYKRKNVHVQVSLLGAHYEMGLQYGNR
ncbi:hypothetical protein AGR56_15005 [Clostridium sp. DMHC 10]|uniref:hypothetical protein n=1 Tax=Clostridium sp. DMHC 10 TaxID=747377 RepID=UPI00069DAB29|nr:hypothetical protein [Clostridium sp. DMHC 10]KOF57617.1 hypothetical protein AGR56_15005 [Clostridium sp. DMHC 10]